MIVTQILRNFASESIYFIGFSLIEKIFILIISTNIKNTMNKKYFFLLTLLFAFLGGVKSEAQITATSAITNQKAYTIKSVDRGYFYFNTADNTTLYSSGVDNVPPTSSQANNQFAFLRGLNTPSGEYYLYSVGAQKFVDISAATIVGGESIHGMLLSDTPSNASKITLTQSDNARYTGYIIKYVSQSGKKVNVTSWHHYGNTYIKIFTCDTDGGNVMKITQAAESFDGLAAAMNKIYEFEGDHVAIQNIINKCEAEKIGYPTKTSGAYTNFMTAYSNGTLENSHLTALYASTDVNMPVEGHAYTFTFKHMDGTRTYLYWDGSKITSAVGTSLPETATFVCHKEGTKYMFVNPSSGKYLVWWGGSGDGAYESNNGFTSAYDSGKNLFQVVKILTGSNVQATNEDLFGCVGLRGERSNPNDQPYFILKNTAGGAVASSVPYVDKTTTNANYRSCAVMIEEVDYYNKLVFRSPATPDGKYYASIYLPYAATVPTGATAYLGTLNGSSIRLTDIQGTVIPKNTAVVMVAESDLATQYIAPATAPGSVPADVTNNLKGTLTTTINNSEFADTYVLNGSFGSIGFYKYTAENLPKGRAYFEVRNSGVQGVQGFLFDFGEEGGETTGINAAALSNEAAKTYYDLSGRRIANPKNGLYICNGKKVYIK